VEKLALGRKGSDNDIRNENSYKLLQKIMEPSLQWKDLSCLQAAENIQKIHFSTVSRYLGEKDLETTKKEKGGVVLTKIKTKKRPIYISWVLSRKTKEDENLQRSES
jgi:hypothetical protein